VYIGKRLITKTVLYEYGTGKLPQASEESAQDLKLTDKEQSASFVSAAQALGLEKSGADFEGLWTLLRRRKEGEVIPTQLELFAMKLGAKFRLGTGIRKMLDI